MSDTFCASFRKDLLDGSSTPRLSSVSSHHIPLEFAIELDAIISETATNTALDLRQFQIRARHAKSLYDCVGFRWCYYQTPPGDFAFLHKIAQQLLSEDGSKAFLAGTPYAKLPFLQFVLAFARWVNGCPFDELAKADGVFPRMFVWAQSHTFATPPFPARPSPDITAIQSHLSSLLLAQPPKDFERVRVVELPAALLPGQPPTECSGSIIPEPHIRQPWLFESLVAPKLAKHIMDQYHPFNASPFTQWTSRQSQPIYMDHEQARMGSLVGDKIFYRYEGDLVFERSPLDTIDDYEEPLSNLSTNWIQCHHRIAINGLRRGVYEHDGGSHYELDLFMSHEMSLAIFSVFERYMRSHSGGSVRLCLEEWCAYKRLFVTPGLVSGLSVNLDNEAMKRIIYGAKYKTRTRAAQLSRQPNKYGFIRPQHLPKFNRSMTAVREAARVARAHLSQRFSSASSPSTTTSTITVTSFTVASRAFHSRNWNPYLGTRRLPDLPLGEDQVECRLLLT